MSAGRLCWSRPMLGTKWGWEGTCGEPRSRPVKSPAYAYPGSNPGPATPHMTCANAVSARPLTPSDRAGFRSDFAPQDAVRTPAAPPRRPRAEHGCRSGWAVGEQDGVRPSGQPWTIGATVAQVRDGELRGSRRYRP